MKGLSRMRGNSHVRFLGEGLAVMSSSYPIMRDAENIILNLNVMDFSDAVPNEHAGFEHETLYIFGKEVLLIERYGTAEKLVPLYIKFNKLDNEFVIVISFHEQRHPLTYYFK